jgi:soluble lytic murein transglycosylase-like protein
MAMMLCQRLRFLVVATVVCGVPIFAQASGGPKDAAINRPGGARPALLNDADLPTPQPTRAEVTNPAYYQVWRDDRINQAVWRESDKRHIDPLLIHALVTYESGGNRRARSRKGASGVMQLMPGTAKRFRVANRLDPDDSVRGGVEYIDWLLQRYDGNVALALAAYNAGEGAVDHYGRRVPPFRETQAYVRNIAQIYDRLVHKYGARDSAKIATIEAPTPGRGGYNPFG